MLFLPCAIVIQDKIYKINKEVKRERKGVRAYFSMT